MKGVARSLGFNVIEKKKVRLSFANYKSHRLNTQQINFAKLLQQKKRQMIANGKIDLGKLIVPIDYTVVTIHGDGRMVSINK